MVLAGRGERVVARLMDGAIGFAFVAALMAAEVVIRAATGWQESPGGDDLSAILGFLMVAAAVLYDPVTTKAFGATPGKRALGLRVVAADGEIAGTGTMLGRSIVSVVCWMACFVPGVLDLAAMLSDPQRRSWHDRAVRTGVVRHRRATGGPGPDPRAVLRDPWRSLAIEGEAALVQYDGAVAAMAPGPVRDTVVRLRARLTKVLSECHEFAVRGDKLVALLPGGPAGAGTVHPSANPTGPLEAALRQRVAQLQSAARYAIALAARPVEADRIDDVALELEALAEALGLSATVSDVLRRPGGTA